MADNNSGTQGSQNNPPKQSGLSWSQPSSIAKPSQLGAASAPKTTPMLKPAAPATQQSGGSGRRTILLFVSGVVVGGLLAWSWFSMMDDTAVVNNGASAVTAGENAGSGSNTSAGSPNALPGASIGNESLVVPATQDAGLSVMVTSAAITTPTWVVVYESQNGVRGNALGAALFFPQGGAKKVNLLRTTSAGKTYFVGRHVDNGDKQFSLTNDKPVVNAAGNPVYVEFRTR